MAYLKPLVDHPIFRTEVFDSGYQQGLAVYLPGLRGHAVRVKHGASREAIAAALIELADWVKAQPEEQ